MTNRSWTASLASALFVALPLTVTTIAQQPTPSQRPAASPAALSAKDRAFASEAAQGGLAEVAWGKLATERGSNDAVKQFGQRMVDDHGKANEELKALAQQKGLTLPTAPSAKHNATQQRLAKLEGAAFDRAYIADMVKDHKQDVAAFERYSKTGDDADLKAWAGKTLPTLREHLQQAQDASVKLQSKSS